MTATERKTTPMQRDSEVAARLSTLIHNLHSIYHEIGGRISQERFAELEQFVRLTEARSSEILKWLPTEAAWRGGRPRTIK